MKTSLEEIIGMGVLVHHCGVQCNSLSMRTAICNVQNDICRVSEVFSNVEMLASIHKELVKKFDVPNLDDLAFGGIFLRVVSDHHHR